MIDSKFSLTQLNQEGYTGPVKLLTSEEAADGRKEFFKTIKQTEQNAGPTSVKPGGFNLKYKWAHEISVNEKILDYHKSRCILEYGILSLEVSDELFRSFVKSYTMISKLFYLV